MSATAMATELASELGDRIKNESEKLRKLELVTRPARKKARKKRSKLGMFTLVVFVGGIAYAVYKMVRGGESYEPTITTARAPQATDDATNAPKQRVATG